MPATVLLKSVPAILPAKAGAVLLGVQAQHGDSECGGKGCCQSHLPSRGHSSHPLAQFCSPHSPCRPQPPKALHWLLVSLTGCNQWNGRHSAVLCTAGTGLVLVLGSLGVPQICFTEHSQPCQLQDWALNLLKGDKLKHCQFSLS